MAVVAAAGIVAAGTVVSTVSALQQQKRQRRLEAVKSQRARQQQFREARIKSASIRQAGINSGAGLDASSVQGGAENVAQQARSNVGFINTVQQLQNSIMAARSLGSLGQGLVSFGSAVGDFAESRA